MECLFAILLNTALRSVIWRASCEITRRTVRIGSVVALENLIVLLELDSLLAGKPFCKMLSFVCQTRQSSMLAVSLRALSTNPLFQWKMRSAGLHICFVVLNMFAHANCVKKTCDGRC